MADVSFPTLVTNQYVVPGAYIGQLITPVPGATPGTRIPAYVGRGSRFAVAQNRPIRRSFLFDQIMTFSPVAPFLAALQHVAINDKSVARLVRADGNEVKLNQWQFVKNPATGLYDQILINTESFDPNQQYALSYQSADRSVLDPLPVAEIREFQAVGNGPDAPDYQEYRDFFADFTISAPTPALTNVNTATALTAVVADPFNASTIPTVVLAGAAAYTHQYNRFYTIRCASSGMIGPNKTATFEWTGQPTSSGNNNLPATPLDTLAPKPTFTITEGPAAGAITVVAGVQLVDGETFTISDGVNPVTVFEFDSNASVLPGNVPVVFTAVDTAATVKAAVLAAINGVAGGLAVTASSGPGLQVALVNDTNGIVGNVALLETVADIAFTVTGMTGGVGPSATVALELGIVVTLTFGAGNFTAGDKFTLNGQGPALIEVDPRLSNSNQFHDQQAIVKSAGGGFATLAYAPSSTPSNVFNARYKVACAQAADTSVKASTSWVRVAATGQIDLTAKVGGSAGNGLTFAFVDPGVPNAPLTVTSTATGLTVALATNATSQLVSTIDQVVSAINAAPQQLVLAAAGGSAVGITVVNPKLNATANVSNGSASVVAGIGVSFLTEMFAGSKVKFSNDLTRVYTVSSRTATTMVLTTPFLGASAAAGAAFAGTVAVTNGSAVVVGTGTAFAVDAPVGTRLKFSSDPNRVYVVGSVASATSLTLVSAYIGVTGAADTYNVPGVDITVTQDPVGKTVLGTDGTFSGTLAWAEYGERYGISGTQAFSFLQSTPTTILLPMSNGVVLQLGLSTGPFVVGDTFVMQVAAPREFMTSKDNRTIEVDTDTIPAAGPPGFGLVSGTFTTDTPEGGFGLWSTTDNAYLPSSTAWQHGQFALLGNILLAARNLHGGPTTAYSAALNRHAAGNKFTFTATINGTIDWSLVAQTSETIAVGSVLTDVNGQATGTVGMSYVILANIPDTVLSVTEAQSGIPLSYGVVQTNSGNNTQFLAFVTRPTVDVVVTYRYRGAEPAPGQIYYVTTKHVRPAELYNTPILLTGLDDARRTLGPSEVNNHLLIMAEIALGDIGAPAIYVTQVLDLDGDDILTDTDFRDALIATEAPRAVSDLIVLSHFSALRDQLDQLDKMADPFKRRLRLGFIGCPTGTPVGDDDTPGSIVFLAKKTLQVFGNNPAHGTRTLVASTWAKRDVTLANRVTVEVTLDGSFVAGALAALIATFPDASSTVLRRTLPGFKAMQVYGDVEAPVNLQLGASNVIFFTDEGGGVFRIQEDVTVDDFAPDFHELNNMTQKMDVTKYVTEQLDSKIIGLVVPSEEAGVGLVTGFMVEALTTLLGQGRVARYQTAAGGERPIDPKKDIVVFRDATNPTRWHLLYTYFLKNTIKEILGLYTVNGGDFAAGV